MVAVSRSAALRWFAPDGTVQQITVRAEAGTSQQQLRDRVAAVLPGGVSAITGKAYTQQQRDALASQLGFLSIFLLVFAGVSLFVGAFIIANTFSMLVAQRTRELALLRAVGASRRQVLRVVLGEAAAVGLVGSVLGLLAGLALAAGLQVFIRSLGLDVTGGLPLRPRTVAVSLLIGLVVTAAAAVLPALRAARIAPVAAMRDDVALPERSMRVRAAAGLVLLATGAACMAYAVLRLEAADAGVLLGVGAGAAFIGLVAAAPLLSRPVIVVLAAPLVAVSRTLGRLARDNSLRNPRRTATTAVSLMIGLTLVSAFSVLAASAKQTVVSLVGDDLKADFVIQGDAPFAVKVAQDAARLPGVGTVVDSAAVPVAIGDTTTSGAAVSGTDIGQVVDVRVTAGDLGALERGELAVSTSFASEHALTVGDSVSARIGVLPAQQLRVGAVFTDTDLVGSDVWVPRALYARAVPAASQVSFAALVTAAPRADLAAVRGELTALVGPQLVLSVQDREQFKDAQAAQIDGLLAAVYALLALSVVIAALGIVNTLALSVFERTREIGLLRAVGMTRRQLSRTITFESVLTALLGAVLGTAFGLTLAVLLQRVLHSQGLAELAVPGWPLAATFALTGVVGVLASLLPARRAARLNVLTAITTH